MGMTGGVVSWRVTQCRVEVIRSKVRQRKGWIGNIQEEVKASNLDTLVMVWRSALASINEVNQRRAG